MSLIVEVDSLTKDFIPPISFKKIFKFDFKHPKPTRALEDVSFKLQKGKILGILGLNGAGKTTLLKIIATLILPDQGSVVINSYCLGKNDEKIKSFIGLVSSSERSFYWRLTGRQNLEFFANLYGLGLKEARARIKELFDFFEVDYQDKRFDSYSTGMQQKFALIRAMLNNPELLLLDEPTKSLDYQTAFNLRRLVKEKLVKEQAKTVIFTTHQMEEASEFGDIFMILHKGRVLAYGSLDELRNKIGDWRANLGEIFLKFTKKDNQ